ncbi:MAG: S-adenosylmethionine decarboxylase family protein [Candidatus Nanopelagicaceae bacterium]
MIYHKHLLVNAKVTNPMNTEEEGINFLKFLVDQINMKIIKGPFASYVDAEGNKGLTAVVMIETSHIAFHIWDEPNPGLLQFDLYTCGSLDLYKAIDILKEHFNVVEMDYVLFDRENGFVVEQSGREADGVWYSKYPNGLEPKLMDPNIGGYLGDKDKMVQDSFWESQQSFEE